MKARSASRYPNGHKKVHPDFVCMFNDAPQSVVIHDNDVFEIAPHG